MLVCQNYVGCVNCVGAKQEWGQEDLGEYVRQDLDINA